MPLRVVYAAALFTFLFLGWQKANAQVTYTPLHDFQCQVVDPVAQTSTGVCHVSKPGIIAQGTDGNLYGMGCDYFTACNSGSVFRITPSGNLTVLYQFSGTTSGSPGLTLGPDGNFYGVTYYGGASNLGTIFKITPSGLLTTLHEFSFSDGHGPTSPPVLGDDGFLYGIATNAGYKIDSDGNFVLLTTSIPYAHSSTGDSGTFAPLLLARDGNFYGVVPQGFSNSGFYGTIFRMTADGAVTILYEFPVDFSAAIFAPKGEYPFGGLAQGSDGNLYGTTSYGGTSLFADGSWCSACGVIFQMMPTGTLGWEYSFPTANNASGGGETPFSGLVAASDGNLYGVSSQGGCNSTPQYGCNGSLFSSSPSGLLTVMHDLISFYVPGGPLEGQDAEATPMQSTTGIIYGATLQGGFFTQGVFYSLDAGLPPFVASIQSSGKVGDSIGILGQGFSAASAVSFNGTTATFDVVSDTYLTAIVPLGASTGLITVDTGTVLSSNRAFRVLASPASSTTTTIASSVNPSNFGQSVTFSASVTANGGVPTGSVTFYDGATPIGTVGLNASAQASLTTAALSAGVHAITATYGGDNNNLASTSSVFSQSVTKVATSVSVASSLNPSVYLQAVTLTATVSAAAGVPSGTVSFYDGQTLIGTRTLGASGNTSISTLLMTAGTHSITASYAGDTNSLSSSSLALTQSVIKSSTNTSLTSGMNPSKLKQSVTFTAVVGPGVPTGTIQFFDGKKLLATIASKNGAAVFTTASLSKGSHSLRAVYSGDANFNGSTSAVLSQVVK